MSACFSIDPECGVREARRSTRRNGQSSSIYRGRPPSDHLNSDAAASHMAGVPTAWYPAVAGTRSSESGAGPGLGKASTAQAREVRGRTGLKRRSGQWTMGSCPSGDTPGCPDERHGRDLTHTSNPTCTSLDATPQEPPTARARPGDTWGGALT